MNKKKIDEIASAVLYEGYLLYPYRPSVKNRQRWTFGGLYPRSYSDRQAGTDPWFSQTECLVSGSKATALSVRIRFLHLQLRRVEPVVATSGGERPNAVPSTWQEAVEREVELPGDMLVAQALDRLQLSKFWFPGRREQEVMRRPRGKPRE